MSARGLSCTAWHRSFWQRVADRLPPRKQWPAWWAANALLAFLAWLLGVWP